MKPFSRLSRYELSKMTLKEISDSFIYEIDQEHFKTPHKEAPKPPCKGHTFGIPRPWKPPKKSKIR